MTTAEGPSPEELRRRELAARVEYPQTRDAFERVRQAARDNLFKTGAKDQDRREELYRLVNLLDRVEQELIGAMGIGSEAIDEYIASLAPKKATTRNPK